MLRGVLVFESEQNSSEVIVLFFSFFFFLFFFFFFLSFFDCLFVCFSFFSFLGGGGWWNDLHFYTLPNESGWVLWYHVSCLSVYVSARPFPHPSVNLSYIRSSIFSFHLSKCQWIFTKPGVCIDIVEIWFGIANVQILSIFDKIICQQHICILVSRQHLER